MGNFRDNARGGSGGFGGRSRPSGNRFGGNRFGGNRGGGRSFGGDRGPRRPLEMHDATCAKCGKSCQVPFRPTGDKPVYCSDCFEKNDSSGPRSPVSRNQGAPSQSSISPEQFNQLNKKLDKIIKILSELEIVPEDEDLGVELDDDSEDEEDEIEEDEGDSEDEDVADEQKIDEVEDEEEPKN